MCIDRPVETRSTSKRSYLTLTPEALGGNIMASNRRSIAVLRQSAERILLARMQINTKPSTDHSKAQIVCHSQSIDHGRSRIDIAGHELTSRKGNASRD